jgi:hypothetical protein
MLMMFPKSIRKLPWEKICPLNENDLLVIMNKNVAFGLMNIADEDNNYFSISQIMRIPENTAVFGVGSFEDKCKDFSEIMDSRLERFFDTKKTDYIFFDKEEQKFLKGVFANLNVTCQVELFAQKDGEYKKVNYEDISVQDFKKFRPFFSKLGVIYVIRPERYNVLNNVYKLKNESNQDKIKRAQEAKAQAELQAALKIVEKYPGLSEIRSQVEFKAFYRNLAKKLHPDVNSEGQNQFTEMNADFEKLKKSIWYTKLDNTEEPQTEQKASDKQKTSNGRTFLEKLFNV